MMMPPPDERTGEKLYELIAEFFDIENFSVVSARLTCKQCSAVLSFSPCGLSSEMRDCQAWVNIHFHRSGDGN